MHGVVRFFVRLLRNVNFVSETQFSGGVFVFSLAVTACFNHCRQYVTLCVCQLGQAVWGESK